MTIEHNYGISNNIERIFFSPYFHRMKIVIGKIAKVQIMHTSTMILTKNRPILVQTNYKRNAASKKTH